MILIWFGIQGHSVVSDEEGEEDDSWTVEVTWST